jgi:hypothetical protein
VALRASSERVGEGDRNALRRSLPPKTPASCSSSRDPSIRLCRNGTRFLEFFDPGRISESVLSLARHGLRAAHTAPRVAPESRDLAVSAACRRGRARCDLWDNFECSGSNAAAVRRDVAPRRGASPARAGAVERRTRCAVPEPRTKRVATAAPVSAVPQPTPGGSCSCVAQKLASRVARSRATRDREAVLSQLESA